ncbi:MAG: hypothetical protein MJ237_08270 [bacterium]|nr:hypothetical protein [bacterium]
MGTCQDNQVSNIIGVTAASAGGIGTYYAGKKLVGIPINKMKNNLIKYATESNSIFKEPAINMLKTHNIKFTEVQSQFDLMFDCDLRKYNIKKSKEPITKLKNYIKNFFPQKLQEFFDKKFNRKLENFTQGANAFALNDKVFCNFDKISASAFHEAGHTKNYTSKFGNFLQKCRNPYLSKALIGLSILGAISSTSQKNTEEVTNKKDNKILHILKKSCIGLAIAGTLPEVLEEGLASYKGNKMAKQVLSLENYKNIKKLNAKALTTYGASAGLIVGSVLVASKIRDFLGNKSTKLSET